MIKNTRYREEFQKSMFKKNFLYRVDIEPTPSENFSLEDIQRIFRKIAFDLNKKYLKNRNFPKLALHEKFYFLINPQDRNNLHYHCLLHFPENFKSTVSTFNDLNFAFIRNSANPLSRKNRKMFYNKKIPKSLPEETSEAVSICKVERIKNKEASVIYNTRQMNFQNDNDFFIA